MFRNLNQSYLGSCILDSLSLVLSRSSEEVRAHIAEIIHSHYYDAFHNAVTHISEEVTMFTRDEFIREVKMLAVLSGLAALAVRIEEARHVSNQDVMSLFRDVRTLCETSI